MVQLPAVAFLENLIFLSFYCGYRIGHSLAAKPPNKGNYFPFYSPTVAVLHINENTEPVMHWQGFADFTLVLILEKSNCFR